MPPRFAASTARHAASVQLHQTKPEPCKCTTDSRCRRRALAVGKMTAAVKKSETSQADVVAYITGTKTQENVGA